MSTTTLVKRDGLWVYAVLTVMILNLLGLVFGVYYGFAYARPDLVVGITPGQVQFWVYVLIFLIEWAFAIALILKLGREGASARDLIAPRGGLWRFRWGPALLLFLVFNILFGLYMARLWTSGAADLAGLRLWQRLFMIALLPIGAAFCEELIWRGYIITRLEARGKGRWSAILLAALSFALIHGIFLLDKLLVTFLIGVACGYYYVRERTLVPLMFSHWFVDLWSFVLVVFWTGWN